MLGGGDDERRARRVPAQLEGGLIFAGLDAGHPLAAGTACAWRAGEDASKHGAGQLPHGHAPVDGRRQEVASGAETGCICTWRSTASTITSISSQHYTWCGQMLSTTPRSLSSGRLLHANLGRQEDLVVGLVRGITRDLQHTHEQLVQPIRDRGAVRELSGWKREL